MYYVRFRVRFKCSSRGSRWNSPTWPQKAKTHYVPIQGLRTPNEALFHWNPEFLVLGRQIGQIKFNFFEKATKFSAICLKVLRLLSKVKTLRQIAPNFCGLIRKAELQVLEHLGHFQPNNQHPFWYSESLVHIFR